MSRPSSIDLAGFWVLWRELHVFGTDVMSNVDTERTIDKLRELGISRSTAYRHREVFVREVGCDPRHIDLAELVDVLRKRQQGALF